MFENKPGIVAREKARKRSPTPFLQCAILSICNITTTQYPFALQAPSPTQKDIEPERSDLPTDDATKISAYTTPKPQIRKTEYAAVKEIK